jgi:hypothetical protein
MEVEMLLTESDVAERLAVTVGALRRLRLDMRGPPAIEISPRVYRYRASDLARWIDQKCLGATPHGAIVEFNR